MNPVEAWDELKERLMAEATLLCPIREDRRRHWDREYPYIEVDEAMEIIRKWLQDHSDDINVQGGAE